MHHGYLRRSGIEEEIPISVQNDCQHDECTLIIRAKNGHEEALSQLMARYASLIKATANRYFLPGAEHDDVVQEGWIGFWSAIQHFDDRRHGYFSGFAKLCVMQIVSAVVRATRSKHQILNSAWSLDQPAPEGLADGSWLDAMPCRQEPSPETYIVDRESSKQLVQELTKELTPLEQKVFNARRQGKSYEEIGVAVDRPPKTIDNALQRIRRKLKITRSRV
jgi:RNA polymerase sporulation-specific sigma factor